MEFLSKRPRNLAKWRWLFLVGSLSFSLFLIFGSCEDPKDDWTTVPIDNNPNDTTVVPVDTVNNCWKFPIVTVRDQYYNQLFTRFGGGWTGSDGTLSIPLPDGSLLWIFGDTFLGTVNPNRSRPLSGLVNNTFAIQKGDELITLYGGTVLAPKAFVTPVEAGWWYWPGHGQVNGDTLEVIMYAMRSNGGTMWSFEYAAVDLLKFSLPDVTLISTERLVENPKVNWGTSVLAVGDYTYIYGARKSGANKLLAVARCPKGSLSQKWEYYTGANWSDDPAAVTGSFPKVSEQFTVFNRGNKFYLMTQNNALGKEIYLYSGDSPEGIFDGEKLLYCTPEAKGNVFTYNAFYHEALSTDDELCISYDVNSFDFQDVIKNADNYRPYFIRVKGWK